MRSRRCSTQNRRREWRGQIHNYGIDLSDIQRLGGRWNLIYGSTPTTVHGSTEDYLTQAQLAHIFYNFICFFFFESFFRANNYHYYVIWLENLCRQNNAKSIQVHQFSRWLHNQRCEQFPFFRVVAHREKSHFAQLWKYQTFAVLFIHFGCISSK